jgi:hypothetical protein
MEQRNTKRFPLREAYQFAADNGLGNEAEEIRELEVDWDRPYTSSVRRGRIIRLFEARGLLDSFIRSHWPSGETSQGARELRSCLKIASDYAEFVAVGDPPGVQTNGEEDPEGLTFALEAHLRDFLARNLDRIEPGLALVERDGQSGIEFPVDGGRIDLLASDRFGKFVVVELKLSRGRNKTLGQLLYYMGWVDEHLGNAPCRGVIVAADISDDLRTAVSRVPGVILAKYRMTFAIETVPNTVK